MHSGQDLTWSLHSAIKVWTFAYPTTIYLCILIRKKVLSEKIPWVKYSPPFPSIFDCKPRTASLAFLTYNTWHIRIPFWEEPQNTTWTNIAMMLGIALPTTAHKNWKQQHNQSLAVQGLWRQFCRVCWPLCTRVWFSLVTWKQDMICKDL